MMRMMMMITMMIFFFYDNADGDGLGVDQSAGKCFVRICRRSRSHRRRAAKGKGPDKGMGKVMGMEA